MADWRKIKTEYMTTDTSYRKLAKKYGVSESAIYARGGNEQWVEQKKQHQSKTTAKTMEALQEKEVDRAKRLMTVSDKLLDRVEDLVERDDRLNATAIKNLSDALKNIKDAQMIRSDKDLLEQDARIAKLQREAMETEDIGSITIRLEGGLEEYAQ